MSAHELLITLMALFAVLGALDRIFGNRFGLGKEFEDGIQAMGSLALAMLVLLPLLRCWRICCDRWLCRYTVFWVRIRLCLRVRF